MKKFFSPFLLLCTAVLLTACGDDEDSAKASGAETSSTAGEAAAVSGNAAPQEPTTPSTTPATGDASTAGNEPAAGDAPAGAEQDGRSDAAGDSDASRSESGAETPHTPSGEAPDGASGAEPGEGALIESARAAMEGQDGAQQAKAAAELRTAADAGDAEAAYLLGQFCEKGIGVQRDPSEALRYYSLAADKGHAGALLNFGLLCNVLEPNEAGRQKALDAFRRSAELGNSMARVAIAFHLISSPEGQQEALEQLRAAADEKNAQATCALGVCTLEGRCGLKADPSEAFRLFDAAATLGHADAICNVAYCYEQGIGVKQNAAQAVALYRELLSRKDVPQAMYNLALCLLEGRGCEQDKHAGVVWLFKAARANHAEAVCELARCAAEGIGMYQDQDKAYDLLHAAAELGSARAQFALYLSYRDGKGGAEQSPELAERYLQAAAKNGYPQALQEAKP